MSPKEKAVVWIGCGLPILAALAALVYLGQNLRSRPEASYPEIACDGVSGSLCDVPPPGPLELRLEENPPLPPRIRAFITGDLRLALGRAPAAYISSQTAPSGDPATRSMLVLLRYGEGPGTLVLVNPGTYRPASGRIVRRSFDPAAFRVISRGGSLGEFALVDRRTGLGDTFTRGTIVPAEDMLTRWVNSPCGESCRPGPLFAVPLAWEERKRRRCEAETRRCLIQRQRARE